MAVTALIGLQWGDEGKGKVVDAVSGSVDVVIRAQGGANAGHTVKVGDTTRVLHLVPSGMLYPDVVGLIGNGVVLDPFQLIAELDALASSGHVLDGRLWISDRAHLVLPYHKEMDEALELLRGGGAIGTTKRGIGPAYMDKAGRVGIRVGEIADPGALRERVIEQVEAKNRLFGALDVKLMDGAAVADAVVEATRRLAPMVTDTVSMANAAAEQGKEVLIEGAQGSLLDVDLGTYPYVTSSNCHLGGLLSGSGLPPRAIGRVVGVAKAYCTRVGAGPFPTEDNGEAGQQMRDKGHEYGSTTGRPRRCGWLDLVALRFAVRTNGVDEIALTKSDVLSGQPSIKVATSYVVDGEETTDLPAGVRFDGAEPCYAEFPGFDDDLAGVSTFDDLPGALRDVIAFVEEACGARVALVSTGPERDQTLHR
ncbi:MAG: adenylosuccinate synthase [Planctomycetes bacterium]|nr:adenylosuccinate synthase [Planctomycetota bacterium]